MQKYSIVSHSYHRNIITLQTIKPAVDTAGGKRLAVETQPTGETAGGKYNSVGCVPTANRIIKLTHSFSHSPLTTMLIFPNAKINIGLNVINRRDDGYHNLETIFYPVNIKDALEIVVAGEISFESSGLEIPGGAEENLCIKGYHLLKKDFDLPPVKIHLHKNIPIGAGLGGGSADAAFFIRLVNQDFNLGMTDEQMIGYARKLGADCAFFIKNKPVFAFEIGDEFEPVRLDLSKYQIALVMPPVHVSTAEAYRGVTASPVKESLMDLIYEPVADWKKYIKNDFEASVFKNHPEIRGVKAALYEAGALYASMSGSGASVFGIFETMPDLSGLEGENEVFFV